MEPHPFEIRLHVLVAGPDPDQWGVNKINEALDGINGGWVFIVDDDTVHDVRLFRRLHEIVFDRPWGAVVFAQRHVAGHVLQARPENMVVGKVDIASIIWRRDFLGDERMELAKHGPAVDGKMAEKMFARAPERFCFCDEILVRKNNLKNSLMP